MRQIHVCAWLTLLSTAVAACSGDKFSSSEDGGNYNGSPTLDAGGSSTTGNSSAGIAARSSQATNEGGDASDAAQRPKPSGGGATSGGNSASGGGAALAGTGSGQVLDCAIGKVTFKMVPDANLSHEYLCDAGCGLGWLSITDAEGASAYSLSSACGTASCETCEVQACAAAACLPKPLTAEGSELVWDGNYFTKSMCGANMACQKPECVKPGRYKAKACAAVNGGTSSMNAGCLPKNELLCAEVEFDFPSDTAVKLVLKR